MDPRRGQVRIILISQSLIKKADLKRDQLPPEVSPEGRLK